MINKRLIALMGNAKKFIGFHVFFQLINLALNITAIFLLADFLQKNLRKKYFKRQYNESFFWNYNRYNIKIYIKYSYS